jgi:hypothetical protein
METACRSLEGLLLCGEGGRKREKLEERIGKNNVEEKKECGR